MPYWRSRELNRSRFFKCLLLVPLILMGQWTAAEPQEEKDPLPQAKLLLKVTLVGISSYHDFKEIKTALAQAEGVEKVALETEAPGVIGLRVRYAGEPRSLIDKLSTFFPGKYSFKEKGGGGGAVEMTISRLGQ